MATEQQYSIRPSFAEKFRPAVVKELIETVLKERLADKTCGPTSSSLHASRLLSPSRIRPLRTAGASSLHSH